MERILSQQRIRHFKILEYIFRLRCIGVAMGGKGAIPPPKFLENIVIFCFEKRFSKQNSVIRLKSNISPPSQSFWADYATATM